MGILENIARKFHLVEDEKSTTEQILEQRGNLKIDIAVKLYKQGFTEEEIENVLQIIITAEDEIQQIKDSLNGTNINPDLSKDPMQPIIDGRAKIREISLRMNEDIRKTIQEYVIRHQNNETD